MDGREDAFVFRLSPNGSELEYSTYIGGNGGDVALRIAVDKVGNAYIAGYSKSYNFPTTVGAFQTAFIGARNCQTLNATCSDGFLAKLNPTGTALVYSTFIGGSYPDTVKGLALDSSGNAYISGSTFSPDFPTTPRAFQTNFSGSFVAKLNNLGSALVYSTFLNATSGAGDVAVDSLGNAYVLGGSLGKLNSDGSALIYLAGTPGRGSDLALDASANAYITGYVDLGSWPPFPYTFVEKVDSTGTILYSKFLRGGSGYGSYGYGVSMDAQGNTYVTGATYSTDFPTTPDALQRNSFAGIPCAKRWSGEPIFCPDAFITKLDPTGSVLTYSTYLAGIRGDAGAAIAVDVLGSIYVAGTTDSVNFPLANPLQPNLAGGYDVFVTKIADPRWMLSNLTAIVSGLNFQQGVRLLQNALNQLNAQNSTAACNQLAAFLNQVQAQSGRQLSPAQADQLKAWTQQIQAALQCR